MQVGPALVVGERPGNVPVGHPYLPWLAPGEEVPAGEASRLPGDDRGLQTEPSYASVSWSFGDITREGGPRLEGNVVLWRTTEPSPSFETDPAVPRLPGGSGDATLSNSEGRGGDWAIIWLDAPGRLDDPCGYTTLVAWMPNVSSGEGRRQILRIAESLVPDNTYALP